MNLFASRLLLAAYLAGAWKPTAVWFDSGMSHDVRHGGMARRKKLKGWQKQARQHGAR